MQSARVAGVVVGWEGGRPQEERKAYHEARRAQAKGQAKAEPKKQLTKARCQ